MIKQRNAEEILALSPREITTTDVVSFMNLIRRFSGNATFIATSDQIDMLEELDDVVEMVKTIFITPPQRSDLYWQGMDIKRKLDRDDSIQ